jgi:hypothetical protein
MYQRWFCQFHELLEDCVMYTTFTKIALIFKWRCALVLLAVTLQGPSDKLSCWRCCRGNVYRICKIMRFSSLPKCQNTRSGIGFTSFIYLTCCISRALHFDCAFPLFLAIRIYSAAHSWEVYSISQYIVTFACAREKKKTRDVSRFAYIRNDRF